jgi:hypothetical protein
MTKTTTDYRDTSGDPYAIPANQITPDQPVSTRKADLIASLGALLAVVTAMPAKDFPELYLTVSTIGSHDWSVQVARHGAPEAARREVVDRIAAIAGLPTPVDGPSSYRSPADGPSRVYSAMGDVS